LQRRGNRCSVAGDGTETPALAAAAALASGLPHLVLTMAPPRLHRLHGAAIRSGAAAARCRLLYKECVHTNFYKKCPNETDTHLPRRIM
jgi:hypothetical protein